MEITGQLHVLAVLTPGNNTGTPEQEAAWATQPVWTVLEKKKKSLAPTGIETPVCPARS